MNTRTILLGLTILYLLSNPKLVVFAQNQATPSPGGTNFISKISYTSPSADSSFMDISYYNGLGDPIQEVSVSAGGTGQHIIRPIVYDIHRRPDSLIFLPFAKESTEVITYDTEATVNQMSYFLLHYADSISYGIRQHDPWKGGTLQCQRRPGKEWAQGNKMIRYKRGINVVSDSLIGFRYYQGLNPHILAYSWPLNPGRVLKDVVIDEAGDSLTHFTNGSGKPICIRQFDGSNYSDTYYIYDIKDSLICIIQPKGVAKIKQQLYADSTASFRLADSFSNENCFYWGYDDQGNVLSEHTPGGGTTLYCYDDRNRSVLRTDDRMSPSDSTQRMVLTLYDQYDRIVEERYVSSPGNTLSSLRSFFRDTVTHTMAPSSVTAILPTIQNLQSATYFPFGTISYASSGDGAFVPETGIVSASDLETVRIKGMLRQETVYPAPDVDGTVRSDAPSVTRYYHYDSKGRVIQICEVWSDDRTRRVSTKYAFTGDVLATKETVIIPEPGQDRVNSLTTVYTRDPRGRVLSCSRVLDDTDTLATVHYAYDDLGRLVGKTVGDSNDPLLETVLSYDLHGWTTGIDVSMDGGSGSPVPVFGEAVRYASTVKDLSAGRFDGNISETAFSHRVTPSGGGTPVLQTHTWSYAYDGLKRLTNANHYVGAQLSASLTDTEKSLGYDLNGNITALKRYGSSGLENDLTFSHTGNRMTALSDANTTGNEAGTKSFTYDANGNMTADGRKGLELSWNLLNLADSAAMHGSSLTYAWLSDGTKVSAKADDGSGHGVVKRYLGSFVFTTSGGSSTDVPTDMESVAWDEGRIFFDIPEAVPEEYIEDPDPEINPDEPEQIEVWFPYRDCWFAGDHLGNVRSVIDITPDLSAPQILEQSDYLPFGTKISNPNLISGMNNRWRYAGKEEQRFGLAGAFSPIGNAPFGGTGFLDLALLDFGARMYDPFTARWTAADPLATCDFRNSPFVFCINNPGSVIDPFGTNWYQYQETGCYFWFDGDEEREGYENLGENLSVQGSDGLYRNFYHNQFLGVSKALISDITSTVINDKSLLGICLSNKSSLSEDDKEALFEKIVSTAGDRFLTHPETLHSVTLLMTVASAADFLGSSYGAFLDCLTRGHVFWSGGIEHAGKMAADYAYSTGMRTLEMTWAGKLLSNLTSLLGYDKTKWLWRIASKQFAKETYGTAHVFLNNPTKESIWLNIEKTTLEKNGVFIITHNL